MANVPTAAHVWTNGLSQMFPKTESRFRFSEDSSRHTYSKNLASSLFLNCGNTVSAKRVETSKENQCEPSQSTHS
jgi:hypothetical protein